jgi:hypothetical protein
MVRTKHQKALIIIALLSCIAQLEHIVLTKYRLISSTTSGIIFAILCVFYTIVIIYLVYIFGYHGKRLFKTYPMSTIIAVIFSLPLLYTGMLLYGMFFKKYYEVNIFTANGKTYKEIKWFYNSGELYTVKYWSTEDKSPLTDPIKIKDSIFVNEDEVREFGRFASERETGDDMVRDSIWLKMQKNGDTIENYNYNYR